MTSGTAVISLTEGASDNLTITYPKVLYSTRTLADTDQLAKLNVQCTVVKDPANGIPTVQAQNSLVAGIGSEG